MPPPICRRPSQYLRTSPFASVGQLHMTPAKVHGSSTPSGRPILGNSTPLLLATLVKMHADSHSHCVYEFHGRCVCRRAAAACELARFECAMFIFRHWSPLKPAREPLTSVRFCCCCVLYRRRVCELSRARSYIHTRTHT